MVTVSPCLTNGGGFMATGMLQQRSDRRAESFFGKVSSPALAPDAYAFRLPEWAWNHSGRTKEGTP